MGTLDCRSCLVLKRAGFGLECRVLSLSAGILVSVVDIEKLLGTLVSRGVDQGLGLLRLGLGLVALSCCFLVILGPVFALYGQFTGVLIQLLGVLVGVLDL